MSSETLSLLLSHVYNEKYNDILSITTTLLNHDNNSNNDNDIITNTTLKRIIEQIHCRTLISFKKYNTVIDYYQTNYEYNNKTNNDNNNDTRLCLEYIYSLYKLGKFTSCRDYILQKLMNSSNGSFKHKKGIQHILAQCQYRLHETNESLRTYNTMLLERNNNHNKNDNEYDDDYIDYENEILTNMLAVKVSNATMNVSHPTSHYNYNNMNIRGNDDIDEIIMNRLEELTFDNHNDDDGIMSEFLYNTGTNLLLQSSSLTQTKKALNILQLAEQRCRDEYDLEYAAVVDDDGDNGDNGNDKDTKFNIAKSKDIMPIQANIALAKMQLGDSNSSMKSYLELLLSMKKIHEIDPSFDGGGALLAVDNNLAVINSKTGSSSSSVFDLLKRIPDLSSIDNSSNESGSPGGMKTVTPCQIRSILYNRAILLMKMNKYSECKTVLSSLKKSLSMNVNETVKSVGSKKKCKGGGAVSGSQLLAAPTASAAETILWESRIALLESEYASTKESNETTSSSSNDISNIENRIKMELTQISDESEIYILTYALAEVLLYKSQKVSGTKINDTEIDKEIQKTLISTLEELPELIRQRPAVVATLYSLYSNLGMENKVNETLESTKSGGKISESLVDSKRLGDFKLRLGMYEEAASIYKDILNEVHDNRNDLLHDDEKMECTAGLIKALSFFDVDKAIEYSDQLKFEQEDFDGEDLEAMEIPRMSKGVTGSSKMRKVLGRHRNAEQK